MERFKIWIIGGEDVHLRLPLLCALRDRGFDVGAAGSRKGAEFRHAGVPYWRYELIRSLSPDGDLRSLKELEALFRLHRPDCIHAFDTKPSILAPLAAARADVPGRVRTITGMGYLFSANSPRALLLRPIYRWLHRWADHASDTTVFQNGEDRAYFLRHRMARAERAAVVRGSGIDVPHLLQAVMRTGTPSEMRASLGLQNRLVVTMVSRLVVQKGVREYLEVARRIRRVRSDVVFLLVGPRSSEGRQAIPMSEIEAHAGDVLYLGPRDDVPAILSTSDLFVLPSYYREGVPRVLLEAGALGLPLVTTDMPGCRDVVRHEWCGLLVPRRDVDGLTAAVLRLISSRDERERMGARARQHVLDNFLLSGVADAYAEIYRQVVADRKGRTLEALGSGSGAVIPASAYYDRAVRQLQGRVSSEGLH